MCHTQCRSRVECLCPQRTWSRQVNQQNTMRQVQLLCSKSLAWGQGGIRASYKKSWAKLEGWVSITQGLESFLLCQLTFPSSLLLLLHRMLVLNGFQACFRFLAVAEKLERHTREHGNQNTVTIDWKYLKHHNMRMWEDTLMLIYRILISVVGSFLVSFPVIYNIPCPSDTRMAWKQYLLTSKYK